jgi:Protein of unknown function (DUF2752)
MMSDGLASQPQQTKLPSEAMWRTAIAGGALILLYAVPLPAEPKYLLCGFDWLTRKLCPFCGLTRSLSFLARGEWQIAISLHPFGPLVFGLLLVAFLRNLLQLVFPGRRLIRVPQTSIRFAWRGCFVLFCGWGVLRILCS